MSQVNIYNGYAEYDCGCRFEVVDKGPPVRLKVKADASILPLDCSRTWGIIGDGNTKGVFQLESRFGQQYAKKLRPENMEHLAALSAILRPGCVSKKSQILIADVNRPTQGGKRRKIRIDKLFEMHHRNHSQYQGNILSYDEQNHCLTPNKIKDVMYNGKKEIYKLKYRKRVWKSHWTHNHVRNFNLKCTYDHPLFVFGRGWTKLQDMVAGDRFLSLSIGENSEKRYRKLAKHQTQFRDICFRNYQYKCVMCDWNLGSLDVNHLEGNRTTNNSPENLCFLCPNHHRMYGEGNLDKGELILKESL